MRKRKNKWLGILLLLVLFIGMLPGNLTFGAEKIKAEKSKVSLKAGNEVDIKIKNLPETPYSYWYNCSSTDSSVAFGYWTGKAMKIRAVGVGSCKISLEAGEQKVTVSVSVSESGLVVSESSVKIYTDQEGKRVTLNCGGYTKESFSYYVYDSKTREEEYGVYVYEDYDSEDTYVIMGSFAGEYLLELRIRATDGQYYSAFCSVIVENIGLKERNIAVAVGKTRKLELIHAKNPYFGIYDPSIATISPDGTVTAHAQGSTWFYMSFTGPNGETMELEGQLYVTNPKVENVNYLCVGEYYYPVFTGVSYQSTVEIESSDTSIVNPVNSYVVDVKKKGKVTLTYRIDGVKLTQTLQVYDIRQSHEVKLLKPKGTFRFEITGLPKDSKVTYKSSDKTIAYVDKEGKVTGKKNGFATITATCDGKTYKCAVTVANNKGMRAVLKGEKVLGSLYSQEKRMQKGYYDCSSFVWRMYDDAGLNLTPGKTYAPTAADLAKYLDEKGKAISYEYLPASQLKPGDIIFYCGYSSNGRYKNIDHVAMFYGSYYDDFWDSEYDSGLVIHASGSVFIRDYSWYRTDSIVMIARPY